MIKTNRAIVFLYVILVLIFSFSFMTEGSLAQKHAIKELWTESFDLQTSSFSTTGKTKYFILEPGYQLTLEGTDGSESVVLVITVLDETQKIGDIDTRVVEEKETANGQISEVSRNFFAICTQTNSIFYFGEDVDIYKDGKIVDHGGSWRAYSENNQVGLMMPGMILLGARYYQEIAPNIAMDRAEIKSITESMPTPAGKFENCLKVEETSSIETASQEYKFYAPRVGLIKDGDLLLTKYGYVTR